MYTAKIDLLIESALLLAAVCFGLSVYVFSRSIGNKLHLAYSLLTLCVSVWAFSFFVANVLDWRLFETVHILSTLALAPVSLLFLRVLLRAEGSVFRWILRTSLVGSVLLIPPVLFGYDRYPWIHDLSFYSPSLIVVANLYFFASEFLFSVKPRGGWEDFARFSPQEMLVALRRRNFWLYLGGVLVTCLCVMDRVSWMGRYLPAVGNLLLALYFYLIKDVVVHQSLVSSRRIIGKLLANAAAGFVAFLVFLLITAWVKNDFTLYLINGFFGALVAIACVDPMRRLATYFYQGYFFKEASRIDELTKEAGKEIAGAFHALAIATATDQFLGKTLDGKMTAFYALDADGKYFRKIQDNSPEEDLSEILPTSFPLMQYWAKAKAWLPILEKELEKELQRLTLNSQIAGAQLAIEALHSLRSTIALPLVHNRSVLGFATISLVEPPEHWDESWGALTLLAPYFERAGEALHELDMYARLRDRDRLATIGEMAAGLAHEIRNPLGAIKGAAQVIEPKPGDPHEPFLKIIVEEVNRLNSVVTQFLNYAKPFQAEAVWADLSATVRSVAESSTRHWGEEGIQFTVEVPDAMPKIKCQPDLLGLVLSNLLQNSHRALSSAAKKSQKSPYISVRLAHTIIRDNLAELSLTVEDNGPGMSPEVLDKAFIPFFTQSPQGTGLGLSICQKIAEAHNGRMEASSVPGEGTSMTLRFAAEWKE